MQRARRPRLCGSRRPLDRKTLGMRRRHAHRCSPCLFQHNRPSTPRPHFACLAVETEAVVLTGVMAREAVNKKAMAAPAMAMEVVRVVLGMVVDVRMVAVVMAVMAVMRVMAAMMVMVVMRVAAVMGVMAVMRVATSVTLPLRGLRSLTAEVQATVSATVIQASSCWTRPSQLWAYLHAAWKLPGSWRRLQVPAPCLLCCMPPR